MRISDWSSDVCSSDLQLQDCDGTIGAIADALESKAYSSRAFIREMGRYLAEHGKKDNSLVKPAYEPDVPIFCPAFDDSSAGFELVKPQGARMKEDTHYLKNAGGWACPERTGKEIEKEKGGPD